MKRIKLNQIHKMCFLEIKILQEVEFYLCLCHLITTNFTIPTTQSSKYSNNRVILVKIKH